MRKSRLIGTAIAVSAIAASGGVAAAQPQAAAQGSQRTVYSIPTHLAGVHSLACFWGTSYTQETRNIIWPESHTDYPVSTDTIPAGGKIVLHGQFPHSRFFSFTITSTLLQLRYYLYDVNIKPDPGSTNPFLPGADRNARHRSYTVTIVDQPDPGPSQRQPNTLYAGAAGQSSSASTTFVLGERVYLPDRGRDFTGGAGDPTASYAAPDGTTTDGQAACTALQTKPGAYNVTNVNPLLFPESKIQQLLAKSSSPEHPATSPAVWYKYFGPAWILAPYYAGTSDQSMISTLPLTATGLGANPANGYVLTWLDRTFGPNHSGHNIAVLHGKLPTTPATYAGDPRMQGGTQLRYWSLCNSEGPTSGKTTGPCLADQETPINAQRDYTVVISLPQDRPANATDKCGVAWMNWGTTGDGYTRPRSTLMIMRNLATVAHPAFASAVQNIADPTTIKHVMGSYLPTVTYTTAAKFEKQGCHAG
ncbi:MAG TPA: hypothetical protein VGY32_07935 [Solirubrobacteraceae bacterium]|jgi:hypothetical protein|nr:hypothetical protein [Solirubrobacteraceae bacterium]